MAISMYLSVVTLNVNGLNTQVRKHWMAYWIKKKKTNRLDCIVGEIRYLWLRSSVSESETREQGEILTRLFTSAEGLE